MLCGSQILVFTPLKLLSAEGILNHSKKKNQKSKMSFLLDSFGSNGRRIVNLSKRQIIAEKLKN